MKSFDERTSFRGRRRNKIGEYLCGARRARYVIAGRRDGSATVQTLYKMYQSHKRIGNRTLGRAILDVAIRRW